MKEWFKIGLQALALAVAVAVGYGLSSVSVKKLSDDIAEGFKTIGELNAKMQMLDQQRAEAETLFASTKKRLDIINSGNMKAASDLLRSVQSNKDAIALISTVGSLTERVTAEESKRLTCIALPSEDKEGYNKCPQGYYTLVKWCSGNCSGDDARVVICCKP